MTRGKHNTRGISTVGRTAGTWPLSEMPREKRRGIPSPVERARRVLCASRLAREQRDRRDDIRTAIHMMYVRGHIWWRP